jgi:hypothetical protein
VSRAKTHVSRDTYEFAKRWIRFKNGSFAELTGLPFKGIIRNYFEPKIVFNILFDFFVIKSNLFLYQGNIYSLIYKCYGPLLKNSNLK